MTPKELLDRCLHVFFVAFVLRIFFLVTCSVRVQHRERLPARGPAIIAANHNSHLDALLVLAIAPLSLVCRGLVRPVAAHDYWFSSPLRRWVAETLLRAVPVRRQRAEGETVDDVLRCAVLMFVFLFVLAT